MTAPDKPRPAFTISNGIDREINIFAEGRVEGLTDWTGPMMIINRIPRIVACNVAAPPSKYAHALPLLPWSYETNAPVGEHDGKGFVYLLDANGKKIGTFWGNPDQKLAVAEMVCDASDAILKTKSVRA